jgi:hypothetical protein
MRLTFLLNEIKDLYIGNESSEVVPLPITAPYSKTSIKNGGSVSTLDNLSNIDKPEPAAKKKTEFARTVKDGPKQINMSKAHFLV